LRPITTTETSRHIAQYDCVCPNGHIVANLNIAQQFRSRANIDAVADPRRPAMVAISKTNRNTLSNHAVVAKHSVTADHDRTRMFNGESLSNHRLARNLDPKHSIRAKLQQLIEKRKWHPKRSEFDPITPPPKAVDQQRP
jgi:hypothetical protein